MLTRCRLCDFPVPADTENCLRCGTPLENEREPLTGYPDLEEPRRRVDIVAEQKAYIASAPPLEAEEPPFDDLDEPSFGESFEPKPAPAPLAQLTIPHPEERLVIDEQPAEADDPTRVEPATDRLTVTLPDARPSEPPAPTLDEATRALALRVKEIAAPKPVAESPAPAPPPVIAKPPPAVPPKPKPEPPAVTKTRPAQTILTRLQKRIVQDARTARQDLVRLRGWIGELQDRLVPLLRKAGLAGAATRSTVALGAAFFLMLSGVLGWTTGALGDLGARAIPASFLMRPDPTVGGLSLALVLVGIGIIAGATAILSLSRPKLGLAWGLVGVAALMVSILFLVRIGQVLGPVRKAGLEIGFFGALGSGVYIALVGAVGLIASAPWAPLARRARRSRDAGA